MNDKLPRFLKNYFNYLKTIKGLSSNTIEGYKIDLTLFLKYMRIYMNDVNLAKNFDIKYDISNIDISMLDNNFIKEITIEDIYAYLVYIEEYRDNNPRTRARKIAALKSFYKYLYSKAKIIDHDLSAELEMPKLPSRMPIHMSMDEVHYLINNIKSRNTERDKFIIIFFLNTGLRLSELCNINLDDIEDNKLTVIGKGNKQRIVYLNDFVLQELKKYLICRKTRYITEDNEDEKALFLSERKKRISKRAVQHLVVNAIKILKSNKNYSTHKLRHTCATMLYQAGVDIRTLQVLLGHQSISTTEIYVHVNNKQLEKAASLNPLNMH